MPANARMAARHVYNQMNELDTKLIRKHCANMKNTPPVANKHWVRIDTSPEVRPAVNANWQARRELAAALRRLNRAALTSDAPTELLQSVTAMVNAEASRIEANESVSGHRCWAKHLAPHDEQLPDMIYETSPVIGRCNAIAPPMHIWQADGRIHASVTPGWEYEGMIEYLHGGVIALLFDHLLALGQYITGTGGRTGTLTIRYHHPTPVNKTLRLVADVDRIEGRKKFMRGELWVDDVHSASCEGVFIANKS